ncbi:MAG: IS5/IS1182 family transposase, partial [Alphaproteobacteria bacterium]
MDHVDLRDAEQEIIGTMLPPDRDRKAQPSQDSRRFLN